MRLVPTDDLKADESEMTRLFVTPCLAGAFRTAGQPSIRDVHADDPQ
jgi:hypothetical protein